MTPDDDLLRALRSAVPRWPGERPGDLWPRMLRRLDEAPPRFGWLEAALLAAIALAIAAFPEFVPVLLWHL